METVRAIAASVLIFEAIVVVLAIPVAISLGDVDPLVAGVGGGVVIALCFVAAAMLRTSGGVRPWAGWCKLLLIASGFVVTAMFIVGGLFAALWVVGLRVGRRGEELHAERWADVDSPAPRNGQPPS